MKSDWERMDVTSKRGLLPDMIVAAAKESYYALMNKLSHGYGCRMTMSKAKEAGVLNDVLQSVAQYGLLGHVATEAYSDIVLREALREAGICNFVTKVVKDKVLEELFIQVVQHGAKTADKKIMLQKFLSGSTLDAYSLMRSFPVDLICDEEDDSAPPIEKAHFLLILAWLLLIVLTLVRGRGLSRTRNAEHRKSVISQVTICSGDIERNPGPLFLNDWLKEMYSMLVRKWKGWQKKKIPWKQFGIPDPRNSRQDRDTLLALFQRYGLLTYCDIQDDSDIYTEEFQLLRVYINDREDPNIDQLDKIVRHRKLLVKFKELYGELSHLPESERGEVQRAVNNIHLQCVPFSGQGEQGAVQEQRYEDESDGANVEDEDEDRGAQIRDGPPQPDCPRGAVVANNEAAMPTSSTIEDSVRQSNGPSGNNPDDFWNGTLTDDELDQLDQALTLLEKNPCEVWSPEGGSPPDCTPTDPASQRSGPKVTNDSDETMKDTPDVTADPQILQPPGPLDVQSQSQKSQNFAIVPVEAPGQTPAPTPVLLQIPTTNVDIRSQMATLVQNLYYLTGIPDLDSRRISENDGGRLTLSRKRSHSLDSGSNCKSSKMVKLT